MRLYKSQAFGSPALGVVFRWSMVGFQFGRAMYVFRWWSCDDRA